MGTDNKHEPDIRPAIAGDVDAYDDLEDLGRALRAEHNPNAFEAEGYMGEDVSLVAGGTGFHVSFNPDILSGSMEVCRPFPGVTVSLNRFKVVDARVMEEASTRALPKQDEIVVRFVHQGDITYNFGGEAFRGDESPGVVTGRMPAGKAFYNLDDGENFLITMVTFTEEGEREVWHRLGIPPSPLFQQLRASPDEGPFLYTLPDTAAFRLLADSFVHLPPTGYGRAAMTRLKVGELFCLLGEHGPACTSAVAADVPFAEVRKLARARALLEENPGTPPSIAELGAMVGLNRRKLTEGFKKVFGETVAGYALELRMRRGYQLLKETQLSVAEIAEQCGYEHPNGFTLAFRRRFGSSPSQVRQQ